MHEVTCFHCGHVANISPDADRCPVCATDLKHLIPPDDASRYFYERAAEMAAAGEITLALLEVERGLDYHPSSELHLLAALLSQRLGNLPQMRQHVAAIAVDDILRPEAEWLLRSHQVDMGALRQSAKKAHCFVQTGEPRTGPTRLVASNAGTAIAPAGGCNPRRHALGQQRSLWCNRFGACGLYGLGWNWFRRRCAL
jgi:hypothetical protein